MKEKQIVLINGSPRPEGNTFRMLQRSANSFESAGISTSVIQLAGTSIAECHVCMSCWKQCDGRCIIDDDGVNEILEKLINADGIILGSPVYHGGMTGIMKMLIDRVSMVVAANDGILKRKIGAAVTVARRAGGISVYHELMNFFACSQMITVGSSYWNVGFGLELGTIEEDEEAFKTLDTMTEHMIWLLESLNT
jgi:multimeric flavodoxin WrbA